MVRSRITKLLPWIAIANSIPLASVQSVEPSRLVVPAGVRVERAAPEAALRFPMFATYDDRGRLYVAESSGLDLYAEISAGTRRCRVSLLEDRDGDGHYESHRVFAEKLVYPMGIAWHDGLLYVADPPDLITLEDTDGDGRSDRRRVILTGFGHKDNGSLHGLVFGPDGLLSMTMGMPDGYRLKTKDGMLLEGSSGAWIRCRADGFNPEVLSRGFVNLVEIAFLPDGEAIGTDNWYQEPAGGFRDALVHLVEGGLYPYVPDSGTPQPVTGLRLPPLARFPAAALSGLDRLEGPSVPADFRDNLVSAQHNTRSVGRHVLIPDGATFRSDDSILISTEDPDFHPSDVLVDGDGSLLVVDTGAWYVQHCPTGRIRSSSSRGGLFRIRWPGGGKVNDPWGMRLQEGTLDVHRLVQMLADDRPAVRRRIRRELIFRGMAVIPRLDAFLASDRPPREKIEAVWALAGIEDPAASVVLRRSLDDPDDGVRCASAKSLGLRKDKASAQDLARCVQSGPPRVRRAAADALARCGDRSGLPFLWSALAGESDVFLRHALIHAVHRIASEDDLRRVLDRTDSSIQAAAMTLLDQPPRPKGSLNAVDVVKHAGPLDSLLRDAATAALIRHPEWADEGVRFLSTEFRARGATTEQLERLVPLILAWKRNERVQELLAESAADRDAGVARRLRALELFGQVRPEVVPVSWIRAIEVSLLDKTPAIRQQAVASARVLQAAGLDAILERLADDSSEPEAMRLEALQALLARRPLPSDRAFDLLIRVLAGSDPRLRMAAAGALGSSRLDDERRKRVLDTIHDDPFITPDVIEGALRPPLAEPIAGRWMSYLEASVRRGWRPSDDRLVALTARIPGSQREKEALSTLLNQELKAREARFAGLSSLTSGGNARRGHDVFRGSKAGCATCHRVGEAGGLVGPDLTRIGAVRSGPDMLESIVYPSASLAQGYEPYSVALDDGRTLQGVIVRQDEKSVVIREPSGTESSLDRSRIEELRRSPTSIMPDGLGQTLSREELRDLLAFLQSLK